MVLPSRSSIAALERKEQTFVVRLWNGSRFVVAENDQHVTLNAQVRNHITVKRH